MFLGLENHKSDPEIKESCPNSIFKPFEKGHIVTKIYKYLLYIIKYLYKNI